MEINIRQSETYRKNRYPVHFVAVDVMSTRTILDQAFSALKFVRLARMSEIFFELLCRTFAAVPGIAKEELEELEPILQKKFMGYTSEKFNDFESRKKRGSSATNYNVVDENDGDY